MRGNPSIPESVCAALAPAGARRVESERPIGDQEEAEGHAQDSGEAGETAREKREGGSTQRETANQHRLRLLKSPQNTRREFHRNAERREICFFTAVKG